MDEIIFGNGSTLRCDKPAEKVSVGKSAQDFWVLDAEKIINAPDGELIELLDNPANWFMSEVGAVDVTCPNCGPVGIPHSCEPDVSMPLYSIRWGADPVLPEPDAIVEGNP